MKDKRIKPQFDYSDQYALEGHFPQEELAPVEVDPLTSTMESMERKPSSAMDSRSAALIADIGAASLPALSALLSGASPRTITDQFNYANNYAKTRGQGLVPSKQNLTALEGPDGEPYYELAEESLGEKPYYQPRSSGAGAGQGGVGKLIPGKHKINGKVRPTLTNNVTGEVRDQLTGDLYSEGDAYLPPVFRSSRGLGGGYNLTKIDPLTGDMNETQLDPGIGDALGGMSAEEAKAALRSMEKAKAASQKAIEAAEGAKRAYGILTRPNLSPELASQGIFAIIKANNGERLSDSDYAQARGDEFKSYLRQAEEWAEGKIGGSISPRILAAYAEAAKLMEQSKRSEADSIKKHYLPKDIVPNKVRPKVDKGAGIESEKEKNDWKNSLRGIR